MKNLVIYIAFIALIISGCNKDHHVPDTKLQPGASAYETAKELSEKFLFLDPDTNKVLLNCDYFNITIGDVIQDIDLYFPKLFDQMKNEEDAQKVKAFMFQRADQLAERKIAIRIAEKENITVSDAELDSLLSRFQIHNVPSEETENYLIEKGLTLDYLKNWLREDELIKRYYKLRMRGCLTATDKEIKAFYDNSIYINARYITLSLKNLTNEDKETKRKLMLKIEKLYKDGFSFDELAKKFSEDTKSSRFGGLIKGIRMGQFPNEVDQIIFSLETGTVSKIINASDSLYLFKIEKRVTESRSFDDVYHVYKSQLEHKKRVDIERKLRQEIRNSCDCTVGEGW